MKNILNNPKRFAIASVTVVLVLAGIYAAFVANALGDVNRQAETIQNTSSAPKPLESAENKPQDAPETTQNTETYVEPSVTPKAPATPEKQQETTPQQPPYEHIPFTNKDVTAGDPESYVGTVGQCPFYEIVNEKGCTPPPDIECNADWSVCTRKEN